MSIFLLLAVTCALTVSFVAGLKERGADSVPLTIWKYFSYYTILSNILVFVWFASLIFWPTEPIGKLAHDANVSAAITFYISSVGIANYIIFGWQKMPLLNRISDLLVHAVTPLFTFLYWIFFTEKEQLQYSLFGYWFIFPLSYAAYTILHGKWSRFYPYEFTNVQVLGLKKVSLNALTLSFSLFVGGTLFILLGKIIG